VGPRLTDDQMAQLQAAISVLLAKVERVADEVITTGNLSGRSIEGLKQALVIPLAVLETDVYEFQDMSNKALAARDMAKDLAALATIARLMGAY
jgi:hypothetical protein